MVSGRARHRKKSARESKTTVAIELDVDIWWRIPKALKKSAP